MGEKKNNINNIFYAVIGVATLIISIIGATFAYFTATASNNIITGNMATINFDLSVEKVTEVDVTKGGIIPMSNNMMEAALTSSDGICVDDNGNAVCQVYKITVNNTSTASMYLDGYVTLTGGSGNPEDYETYNYATNKTTMRWAQAFCTEDGGELDTCTTEGSSTSRTSTTVSIGKLGVSDTAKGDGHNIAEIKSAIGNVTGDYTINSNTYKVINSNYIRVSDHTTDSTSYDRTRDITSALVYSQYLDANDEDEDNNTGTSATTTFTDSQVYYIVVWLSENGHNQTAGSTGAATSTANFFQGRVTFISSQGSEVTATFAGNAKVESNT